MAGLGFLKHFLSFVQEGFNGRGKMEKGKWAEMYWNADDADG